MSEPGDTVPSAGGEVPHAVEAYCPECGQSFPPDHIRCPNDAARLVRLAGRTDPLIGRVFEQRYEVRSRLGEGGMGAVYRGWQLSVDREVAIKVIDPKLSGNRGVVKRFLREARLSSRLNQPSIVNVYDFGQSEDGILYIVMELLRGHTLGRELEAHRGLGVPRAVHIAVQLCDALDAAHKQGIIHRDLKPGNVMLLDDPPGRDLVKVLDFGLAKSLGREAMSKVTHSDALLGTPLYMAPEQISGQPTDQRVDLYALGCMLHEMVSGTAAFGGPTIDRVLSNHLYELAAPLPPDLPPVLRELIMRLIAKHPGDRPQTAAEVRRALLGDATVSRFEGVGATITQASSHVVAHAVTPMPAMHAVAPTSEPGVPAAGIAAPPGMGTSPTSMSPTSAPATSAPATSTIGQTGERPRRRWWIGVIALLAVATMATAIAIHFTGGNTGEPRRTGAPTADPRSAGAPPADAASPVVLDAAPLGSTTTPTTTPSTTTPSTASTPTTNTPPHDAAPAIPLDAGRPASRPPRRPTPTRPESDAGVELDFYRPDAGR